MASGSGDGTRADSAGAPTTTARSQVVYSMVTRGPTVLAEHSRASGNFEVVARLLLGKLPAGPDAETGPKRFSFEHGTLLRVVLRSTPYAHSLCIVLSPPIVLPLNFILKKKLTSEPRRQTSCRTRRVSLSRFTSRASVVSGFGGKGTTRQGGICIS